MFAGDIVVYPVPYVGASHPLPWIDVLQAIERTPIAALVPGHGPPMADLRYVALVRELFEATRDRVREAMRRGVLMRPILEQVDLANFAPASSGFPIRSWRNGGMERPRSWWSGCISVSRAIGADGSGPPGVGARPLTLHKRVLDCYKVAP